MKKLLFYCFLSLNCLLASSQQQSNPVSGNVPGPKKDCCSAPAFVITMPVPAAFVLNFDNTLSFSQSINISTNPSKNIVSIAAELNYFEFLPGSEDCLTCNKNSATFGNFSSGIIATSGTSGAGTHVLKTIFPSPRPNGNFPASFTITLPPVVKCCEGLVRWCIRYVITLDDCTVCTKVVCYEKRKAATTVVNTKPNTQN